MSGVQILPPQPFKINDLRETSQQPEILLGSTLGSTRPAARLRRRRLSFSEERRDEFPPQPDRRGQQQPDGSRKGADG